MGTFLAPLPSPQPIFGAANDPEFSSILAELFDMNDGGGGEPPRTDQSFTADTTTLPAFSVHQHEHDQPGAGFPWTAAATCPGTAGAGTSRLAKRRRGEQTASSPSGSGGENAVQAGVASTRASRQVWVRERSTKWWDRLNGPSCPDAEFRRAFRMSRATFAALCDALGGSVAKEDTPLRAAIPVRQRVAVCVWRLATVEPLREVSRRFGLGISTCHSIVLQVCHALATVLMPVAIHWPDPAAAAAVAARLEVASGLPGVIGAVYTTHVPIVAPKANVAAYYDRRLTERNQKASYSVANMSSKFICLRSNALPIQVY
ncbi:hypothetical protein C2845_PM05G26030 [Panicum miliaceum]|uniref:Nuclease HARBI1 n=1 Tax=Panicum miliaceum TaxID=4540 RepID=A0A3L6SUQ3_PANMI|nr:hypothetical protein C2845_PM05G26030 [Panicum miliaceum]